MRITSALPITGAFKSNIGKLGGQEVPHFHIHIFGKQDLGPMLSENLG